MMVQSLVAYLHFLSAFGLAAVLFFEWLTFSRTPTLQEARRLALADRGYGIFAVTLLIAGFARALHFEKGFEFYRHSPFFHWKLGLFVLMGLLSIYPTVQFIRWGKDLRAGRAPQMSDRQHALIARMLTLQLVALILLLLAASLMAHGVGLRSAPAA